MTASGYIDAIRILPLSLANAQIEDFCGISNFFRDADSFCYNQYVDRFKKAERDEYGDWQTSMRMALSVCRLIKEKGADPKIIVEPTCGKGHFILAALQTFDNIEEIYGIEIHEPFDITEKVELFGHSDNKIIIGANNQYRRMRVLMGSKNTLQIGRNTTTVSVAIHMFSGCNRIVSIGDDCQFSWDIMIRTTDAHTVYDKDTREIINPAKDVYIGNHVWVAKDVTILKGSCIPSNSVVGVASVVNKEFYEENTIIAGTTAIIVKRNINWDRRGVADFA